MPRIMKDYKARTRTPVVTSGPTSPSDEARMSGNSGSGSTQSNKESMIQHEKAVHDRAKRKQVPNQKLRAK